MSLDRHFGYLEEIELTIHIHDLLPTVKLPLASSVDEVFKGDPSPRFRRVESAKGSNKRGPASKLQQQIEQVRQLPRAKQQFVMEMLDTVIQQAVH